MTPQLHTAHQTYAAPRLLRLPDVSRATGLARSSLYDLMAAGRFPRPVALTSTARAWLESEVMEWVAQRIAARDAKTSSRLDGQNGAGGAA